MSLLIFFLLILVLYCTVKVYILLLIAGGYSPANCWRGGSQCDLVTLLKQPSPPPDTRPEYVFHGLGQEFYLVLRPDTLVIQDKQRNMSLVIQDKQRNMSLVIQDKQRNMSMPEGAACFYSGHVRGDTGSSVAVSLCKGMVS